MPRKNPLRGQKARRSPQTAEEMLEQVAKDISTAHKSGGRTAGQRKPREFENVQYITKFKLNKDVYKILKLHALQRGVFGATIISDIITGWVERATDFEQQLFKQALPPGTRIPDIPERWYGYLRSLGFDPRHQPPTYEDGPKYMGETVNAPEPQPNTLPPTVSPAFIAPPSVDPATAPLPVGPMDPGLDTYEHINPLAPTAIEPLLDDQAAIGMSISTGAKRFNPADHAHTTPGAGNAAQRYTLGMPPIADALGKTNDD